MLSKTLLKPPIDFLHSAYFCNDNAKYFIYIFSPNFNFDRCSPRVDEQCPIFFNTSKYIYKIEVCLLFCDVMWCGVVVLCAFVYCRYIHTPKTKYQQLWNATKPKSFGIELAKESEAWIREKETGIEKERERKKFVIAEYYAQ